MGEVGVKASPQEESATSKKSSRKNSRFMDLFNKRAKHAVIYKLGETSFHECVLPVSFGIGQAIKFNTDVVVGQAFPAPMFDSFDQHIDSLAEELFAEDTSMGVVQLQKTLAAGFLDLIFDLSLHTGGCGSLAR